MKKVKCFGSERITSATIFSVLAALLFFGAMFWAGGRDPFVRIWCNINTPHYRSVECIAVLPKMSPQPLPLVIYLHGSGASVLESGNELRQLAEMGLAAIGINYNQTNSAAFEEQFIALNQYARRQRWADTNRIAWVGFSLGAQRLLSFSINHPDLQPNFLVRLAGGWVPELDVLDGRPSSVSAPATSFATHHSTVDVFLVHGQNDQVFAPTDTIRIAACLRSNGVPVELKILAAQEHGFGPNRQLVFRAVAESCLTQLKGPEALNDYSSILSWQSHAEPLWLFWIPASAGASFLFHVRRRQSKRSAEKLARWEIKMRWVAAVLAVLAIGQTALHLLPPRLSINQCTLAIARKHLVQQKELSDFDFLASSPTWVGRRLETLLTHAQLAHYNRELINWKLDEKIYRDFVLSPEIDPAFDGDVDWRRVLWENFYPRIRKENTPEEAAEIVVRFLRERVTITGGEEDSGTISEMWLRQIANAHGFEAMYVAALRSVGVPARLNSAANADFWTGTEWKGAPRPLIQSWTTNAFPNLQKKDVPL